MEKDRQYKLSVIWKTMDTFNKFIFLDDSECYFVPKLKLERWANRSGKFYYELLRTNYDLYRPVEDMFVDHAYDNSLDALSAAICLHEYERKLDYTLGTKDYSEEYVKELKEKIEYNKSKIKNTIEEIQENYGKTKETI